MGQPDTALTNVEAKVEPSRSDLSMRPFPRVANSTCVFELLKGEISGSFFRASVLKLQCHSKIEGRTMKTRC